MEKAAAALLVLLVAAPLVAGDPIPASKPQLETWFQSNVGTKGTLDPALAAAEASPKVIKVSPTGGNFRTISDAVKSVPSGNTARVIISIASGTYQEPVTIGRDQPFVTLLGDPKSPTTLVAGKTAATSGTVNSATLIVEGNYCVIANMVIRNSAPLPDGKAGEQALALRVSGDKVAVYKTSIYGFQDTLCDDKGMHLYKDCHIEGTVDFIFGSGKSLFLNNELVVMDSKGYTMIAAHAREEAAEDTGFVFAHCTISGNATNAMLGRAWMTSPRVVYAYTEMSNVVSPQGWSTNFHPERASTVFFGEYQNTGPGADRANRAAFSKGLSATEVAPFLTLDLIQGSKWLLPPPAAPASRSPTARRLLMV